MNQVGSIYKIQRMNEFKRDISSSQSYKKTWAYFIIIPPDSKYEINL